MNLPFRAEVAAVPGLLRGDLEDMGRRFAVTARSGWAAQVLIVVIGAGLYGTAMGSWRDPLQAAYTAAKLPLALLLTGLGNALLNAMLAPLLGLPMTFGQAWRAILSSFVMAAVILGAFAPLLAFFIWNAPPMRPGNTSEAFYSLVKLLQVAAIAFAGVAANVRLYHWLRHLAAAPRIAGRVLAAWLAGNLLLGAQLIWVLRPFIGSPWRPVQFLRPDAFAGNFFENGWHSLRSLFAL